MSAWERIQQVIGYADIISEVGGTLNEEIAGKLLTAVYDPTSANVTAVFAAYTRYGMVTPPKLAAYLLMINEQRHPEDTIRGAAFPWVIAAIAGLIFIFSFRKKR